MMNVDIEANKKQYFERLLGLYNGSFKTISAIYATEPQFITYYTIMIYNSVTLN